MIYQYYHWNLSTGARKVEESQTALQAKSDEAGNGDSATGPDVCSFPQDSLFGGGGSYTHDYFFVPTM